MEEFITYRCPDCGGPSHPASGCQYTPTYVVCGPCTRRAWKWIISQVNGKGRRNGINFYDHVNRIAPPISATSTTNEVQLDHGR